MSKSLAVLLLVALPAAPALDAQGLEEEGEGRVVATLVEQVDAVFADYDSTVSPGCSLGIVQNGELTYARGYGMASLDHGAPIGPRSVFRIGSTSKQFTAFAIQLLVDHGKVDLDADVRRYLPELPEYESPVTVRQLVHHTSGYRFAREARFEIRPIAENRFVGETWGTAFEVVFDGDGATFYYGADRDERPYVKVELAEPSAENVARLAGDYRCDELMTTVRLRAEDASLWLSHENPHKQKPESAFLPTVADTFESDGFTIQVSPNPQTRPVRNA